MQIKDLAKATGVEIETIRFYEKKGLLALPARRENGYREYSFKHVQQLSFIRHCRALDIPLLDVSNLLSYLESRAGHCLSVNHLIDNHIAKVRARVESMKALEQQLCLLRSHCSDTDGGAQCGILNELVSAASGEFHAGSLG